MGKMNAYKNLVGKHERNKRLARSRKVKMKLYLCLTKNHTMKTHWGSEGIVPDILDLGTRWR
jgi:hypothetical protein